MKIAKKIIFVGGIHGVGKGYLCNKISKVYKIKYFSASKIIKWEEISSLNNKSVEDINFTQNRLIKGLNEVIKNDKYYILDGHYCLLNTKNEPESVNIETFELINPIVLSVVVEDIEIIARRLSNRDKTNYNFELLKRMQDMEIDYAQFLSKKLNIPFVKIYKQDYTSLIKYFSQ